MITSPVVNFTRNWTLYLRYFTQVQLIQRFPFAISGTMTLVLPNQHKSKEQSCAIMFMNNLARLEWMFICCKTPVVEDVFCLVRKRFNISVWQLQEFLHGCDTDSIKYNKSLCVSAMWQNVNKASVIRTGSHQSDHFFELLFNCTNTKTYPPYLDYSIKKNSYFTKFFGAPEHTVMNINSENKFALVAHSKQLLNLHEINAGYMIKCKNNSFISITVDCDHSFNTSQTVNKCPKMHFLSKSATCMKFIFSDQDKVWFSTKRTSQTSSLETGRLVSGDARISTTASNEGACEENGLLQCARDNQVCYAISKICSYILDQNDNICPCKGAEHMQNCGKFECNAMFKCPGYYCIPFRYICNGKWDCPEGSDEAPAVQCGQTKICTNMLKCQSSATCVHLGEVCNGIIDCPHFDDEKLCILHKYACPQTCTCLALAMQCKKAKVSHLVAKGVSHPFHSLDIDTSALTSVSDLNFPDVLVSTVTKSSLTHCVIFRNSKWLLSLNLSFNHIASLKTECFHNSPNLNVVAVLNNVVSVVRKSTFEGLIFLQIVDLSNICLRHLNTFTELGINQLRVLSLHNNSLSDLEENIFRSMTLTSLQTDDFHLCCMLPQETHCSEEVPWYFGCSILLTTAVKVTFYCVSVVIFLANTCSLVVQVVSQRKQSNKAMAFSFTVGWINAADLTCSVSLVILWVSDLAFGDTFPYKDSKWRSSATCFTEFGLVVNFVIIYPLLLSFLSCSRFMVVEHPMTTKFKSCEFVLKCLASFTGFSFLVSVLFTLVTWGTVTNQELPFFLCSPFVDPSASVVTVDILTWYTSILTLSASIFIIVIYIKLFLSLKASQKNIQAARSKQASNFALVAQLIILTGSNLVCWIPTSVLYLTSGFLLKYPTEMLLWIQVAVTPINSIVNPIVFIVTSVRNV